MHQCSLHAILRQNSHLPKQQSETGSKFIPLNSFKNAFWQPFWGY